MKVRPECAICLLRRGISQLKLANVDSTTRFKAIRKLLELLYAEFGPESVPAYLGTTRDRIIRELTGEMDPYRKLKVESNRVALRLEPFLISRVESYNDPRRRFREACLIAITGNAIEYDVMGHKLDLNALDKLVIRAEEDLVVDDIDAIYELLSKRKNVLYLTDNCGEIVFDKILVKELQRLGAEVTVAVKGGPILNDATIEDAEAVNLAATADKIITTGTDAVGVILDESSPEFLEAFKEADLIFAKGMGNWENLPEQSPLAPVAHLFRTKCKPIADSLGVPQHKNVAKLLMPGEPYDRPQA
ncbi:MAG: damage-control phosphatase ARMT1 family protein [Candidatus Ranarchaeia archaeon]